MSKVTAIPTKKNTPDVGEQMRLMAPNFDGFTGTCIALTIAEGDVIQFHGLGYQPTRAELVGWLHMAAMKIACGAEE